MALNIPMPDLPGTSFLKGIDSGSNMFAKLMNARYNASLHPSGDVANALYVEQLRNQFGDTDPRYLQAKRAHEMGLQARQSLMDYRTQLSNLAPYRAATPEEKLIAAQQGRGVLQTFGGNRGAPITAGMVDGADGQTISEDEARVYNQALGKKTTDAAIRNKIPFAENVKITMDSIDPDALVQYSGPQGTVKLGADTLRAAMGNPSPEFSEYQRAITGASTLSKQLRQFWGDSIQPAALEKIDQLTNPSHWLKNPAIAKQQFMQLKNITDQELASFTRHGTSPLKLDYDKKTGNFFANDDIKNTFPVVPDKSSRDFLNQMEPQLVKINPSYTAENIKHTAQTRGISVEQVVEQLLQRQGGG